MGSGNRRVRLPSGPKLTFDAMSERVKIMRLLVISRIPPGHREESADLQDEIGVGKGGSGPQERSKRRS